MDLTPLRAAARHAEAFLESLSTRPVHATATVAELRASLGGPLPETGVPAERVVHDLVRAAEPGLLASASPRFFGFVIGGTIPAAIAADWLTSAWDQNAGLYACGPAASVVEEVAAAWLLELLGLPTGAGIGFVTGCQMANFAALGAARHAVLARAGWDVEERGLQGAPRVRVIVSDESHVTVFSALRMLGLGQGSVERVPTDAQGRMRADAFASVLGKDAGPTIVCTQAGNVNTGAFDPLAEIVPAAHARGAWVHVDGAFGLWAAVSPQLRPLLAGAAAADSWATDAHKWLNVPYDSGIAVVADEAALRGAMAATAAYLIKGAGEVRDQEDWVPEFSRRARGFPLYAALRALGRTGVREMIERGCAVARHMAERLAAAPGVTVLNDVVLNQVLVRFRDDDAFTRAVVQRVQDDGTCWLSGTTWHGLGAMRISVSNWATTIADGERSVAAILKAAGHQG